MRRRKDPPSATAVFDITPWWLTHENVDHPDATADVEHALAGVVEIVRQHLRTYPVHDVAVGDERVTVTVPIGRPQDLVYLQEQLYRAREVLDALLTCCGVCKGNGVAMVERRGRAVEITCPACDGRTWTLTASEASSSIASHAQAAPDTDASPAPGASQHPDRSSSKKGAAARAAADRARSATAKSPRDRRQQSEAQKARNRRTSGKA